MKNSQCDSHMGEKHHKILGRLKALARLSHTKSGTFLFLSYISLHFYFLRFFPFLALFFASSSPRVPCQVMLRFVSSIIIFNARGNFWHIITCFFCLSKSLRMRTIRLGSRYMGKKRIDVCARWHLNVSDTNLSLLLASCESCDRATWQWTEGEDALYGCSAARRRRARRTEEVITCFARQILLYCTFWHRAQLFIHNAVRNMLVRL